ncbi:hypothetical protein Ais01nite_14070 [Asanoa ishikariensis]|uniref:hypothetical protein n=1 Tax=Asanoa ishikariensis TaxID=137265 RepID=UPI000B82F430|nr:hypothetical protein [Asanoa ishikariensis]GIF63372.1 hypothetical protein Ais01nite_14070 [Asanoa ishikariensis]
MRLQNSGATLLELVIEPWGRDYWLRPGEVFVVSTAASPDDNLYPGTTHPDEPFEVDYRPQSMTVHCNGLSADVTDSHGNELTCGHQRPETAAEESTNSWLTSPEP